MHLLRGEVHQTFHCVPYSMSAIQKNHSSSFQASCNAFLFSLMSPPTASILQEFLLQELLSLHFFLLSSLQLPSAYAGTRVCIYIRDRDLHFQALLSSHHFHHIPWLQVVLT